MCPPNRDHRIYFVNSAGRSICEPHKGSIRECRDLLEKFSQFFSNTELIYLRQEIDRVEIDRNMLILTLTVSDSNIWSFVKQREIETKHSDLDVSTAMAIPKQPQYKPPTTETIINQLKKKFVRGEYNLQQYENLLAEALEKESSSNATSISSVA